MANPSDIVTGLRNAFNSGVTKPAEFRLKQLNALLRMYKENEKKMLDALAEDLRKSKFEAVMAELSYVVNDVNVIVKHLAEWMEPEHPPKGLLNVMDEVVIHKEPYGVVLIIGAWNYPLQLTLAPLHAAIAAGNCAVIKPSEVAPSSAKLLAELVPKYLDNDCYKVYLGGVQETTELLKERFDYIFYTGSTAVGRIVQQAAAKHLTPTTLELGGKSPCYIDKDVDLDVAVNRILWGKLMNVGQTCIAPDYILCTKEIQKRFVEKAKVVLQKWFGDKIKQSPDYGRIINDSHFKRIVKLLDGATIAYGGDYDASDKYIQPTILTDVTPHDPVMQEEIFGPILPILNVENVREAVQFINAREKPLALYIFASDSEKIDLIMKNTSSGNVCVNDTLMHFNCEALPFGGVGNSGIGSYHGKFGFDTFSHKKGALVRSLSGFGEKMQSGRYPPYTQKNLDFITKMSARNRTLPINAIKKILTFGLGVAVTLIANCAYHYFQKRLGQHK